MRYAYLYIEWLIDKKKLVGYEWIHNKQLGPIIQL